MSALQASSSNLTLSVVEIVINELRTPPTDLPLTSISMRSINLIRMVSVRHIDRANLFIICRALRSCSLAESCGRAQLGWLYTYSCKGSRLLHKQLRSPWGNVLPSHGKALPRLTSRQWHRWPKQSLLWTQGAKLLYLNSWVKCIKIHEGLLQIFRLILTVAFLSKLQVQSITACRDFHKG